MQKQQRQQVMRGMKIPKDWILHKIGQKYFVEKPGTYGSTEMIIYQALGENSYLLDVIIDEENQQFLIEVVKGAKTLGQWLDQKPEPDLERKNKIITQLVDAVKDIHEKDIAISDLKPDNILVVPNDVIKIIDFNASYITGGYHCRPGTTAPYGAPQTSSDLLRHYRFGHIQSRYCKQVLPYTLERIQAQDRYILGLLIYMILTGNMSYADDIDTRMAPVYTKQFQQFTRNVHQHIPRIEKQLTADIDIRGLFRLNPQQRQIRGRRSPQQQQQLEKPDYSYHDDVFQRHERPDITSTKIDLFIRDFGQFIKEKLVTKHMDEEDKKKLRALISQGRKIDELSQSDEILILIMIARRILLSKQKPRKKDIEMILDKIKAHSEVGWMQYLRLTSSRRAIRKIFADLAKYIVGQTDPRQVMIV